MYVTFAESLYTDWWPLWLVMLFFLKRAMKLHKDDYKNHC